MINSRKELYSEFISPSAEWRGKPFWSWNGELDEHELCRQVSVLKEMGFGGHFMHSRSGLITEYLGDEWFHFINSVSDKSEADGMEAWLYDEDRWPSGSAGGKATVDPSLRMKSFRLNEYPADRVIDFGKYMNVFVGYVYDDKIGLLYYQQAENNNEAEKIRLSHKEFSGGSWCLLAFDTYTDPDDSNYNGSGYLNTMDENATRKFIDLTHKEYEKRCGSRIGSSIKGIFTDEPHRGHGLDDLEEQNGVRTCSIAWTDDFFEEFEKRYRYNPLPILPELFYRYKNEHMSPIKIDWFDLACNLFNERFAAPIEKWCHENNMLFTGHVLHEDELINQTVSNGSLMRFYEHMDVPGVDTLGCDNYRYWIVKQLSSAARQTGKEKLLSELYGCTGWNFDFTGHKNIGDWQALFGINIRCPHLSWYTMEGEAKRDYPASILHQSPWYKDYSELETYFARLGIAGSGKPVCDTLVLNPIESVWGIAYAGWSHWLFSSDEDIDKIEKHYEQLFEFLVSHNIDFDYGEEQMMSRLASVCTDGETPLLKVGKTYYKTVVVSGMLTMRKSTLELLKTFRNAGGKIIFAGDVPAYLGGLKSTEILDFSKECTCVDFDVTAIATEVKQNETVSIYILDENGNECKTVFSRLSRLEDGLFCLTLLNTDIEAASGKINVKINIPTAFCEEWALLSGERYRAEIEKDDNCITMSTCLENGDTKLFIFTDEKSELPLREKGLKVNDVKDFPNIPLEYKLNEENVCVLDRVSWKTEGTDFSKENEVLKADREIRDYFKIRRRGGQMVQPWYSALNGNKVLGRIEMKYKFFIDELPSEDIYLAGERPERMRYKINGVGLEDTGEFWVDAAFRKMRIPKTALKAGLNEVTVSPDFSENTNFEAVFLLGGFGVRTESCYTYLTTLPERLPLGDASKSGLPFYGADITYIIRADALSDLRERIIKTGESVFLAPSEVRGSLIRYSSKAESGKMLFRPYEADVTKSVAEGCDIELTLVGNRRNTFGPLHMLPANHKGSGPNMFVTDGESWSDSFALPETGIQKLQVLLKK